MCADTHAVVQAVQAVPAESASATLSPRFPSPWSVSEGAPRF